MNPFLRDPRKDSVEQRMAVLKNGAHLFFRQSTRRMQQRFCQLAPVKRMPAVFLHGNPHLDNYARTTWGTAMVDFDRSRIGPYGYDLVRFLISLAIRAKRPTRLLLTAPVRASLRRGYLQGLLCPELGIEEMEHLRNSRRKQWHENTNAFLAAQKGWAKRLVTYAIDPETADGKSLVERYAKNVDSPDLVDRYRIAAMAEVAGTMGKKHTLVHLKPKKKDADSILLDFKETYCEPDNKYFKNPYPHEGQRMCEAQALYAPGWDPMAGFVTHKKSQLWVRRIGTFKLKLKRQLREAELMEVAFAVGSQLGRAHGQSVTSLSATQLAERFRQEYEDLVFVASTMLTEVQDAYARYEDRATRLAA